MISAQDGTQISPKAEEAIRDATEKFQRACRHFAATGMWGDVTITLPFEGGAPKIQRLTKVETFKS